MKLSYLFTAVIFSITLLVACTGETKENLSKKYSEILMSQPWKYDKEAILAACDFTTISFRKREVIEGISESMSRASVAFLPDSVMSITLADGSRTQGKWYITDDGKYLFLQSSMVRGEPQEIVEISPNRIHVVNDPKTGLVFPKIYVPRVDKGTPEQ